MALVALPSLLSRVGLLPPTSPPPPYPHPPLRPHWRRDDPGSLTLSPIESRATLSHLYPCSNNSCLKN